MYNANGSERYDDRYGSTNLHMDLTDAVNIMVWTAKCSDGNSGYALWHIFPAAVSDILRKFLREECFDGVGDPIHSQSIYVNPVMLQRLSERYNVEPYVIHQRQSEAVFIPAGCAHQVCRYP
jgi:hypothetical protein